MAVKKLSQRGTDEAFEALLIMTEPASAILQDEEIWKALEGRVKQGAKASFAELAVNGAAIFANLAQVALKKHRENVYKILSVMTEKTVDEIKAQPLSTTMAEILECKNDEDLRSFFTSLKL